MLVGIGHNGPMNADMANSAERIAVEIFQCRLPHWKFGENEIDNVRGIGTVDGIGNISGACNTRCQRFFEEYCLAGVNGGNRNIFHMRGRHSDSDNVDGGVRNQIPPMSISLAGPEFGNGAGGVFQSGGRETAYPRPRIQAERWSHDARAVPRADNAYTVLSDVFSQFAPSIVIAARESVSIMQLISKAIHLRLVQSVPPELAC